MPCWANRQAALDIATVRKVLILRNDKIGDMIVTAALLRELKKNYPHWQIDVAASSANRDVIADNPHQRYPHLG
jgi:ADP-heptose:LPS heptosyltransferase